MTEHQTRNIRSISQIRIHTIRAEESLNLIPPLPIRFVSAEHTTIIGRPIDHNLCIHVPVYKLFAQQTNRAGYFPIRCRTAFLLRTDPVPVSVRFIERTDIVELDAIVLFYSLHYICQKTSVLFITIRFQVRCTSTAGIGSQSVLCVIHRGRVQKSQKFVDSPFFCQFQEIALPLLFVPVVCSVGIQETFGTHPGRGNLTVLSLLRATCSDIETPE